MELVQIGIIHSPYNEENPPPRQGKDSEEICQIEVFEEYKDGLLGLEEGFLIDILYWGSKSDRSILISDKSHHGGRRGVFSLRAPVRPNPILINSCRIIKIEDNIITVKGMDAYDGSPLIDIKITLSRRKTT